MVEGQKLTNIVLVGGGHCNVQVIKLLKQKLPPWAKVTMVADSEVAYYSGMLPGSSSELYDEEQIKIHLPPLATWSRATFVKEKVTKVVGKENKLLFESGREMNNDVLVLNVGSKTRHTETVKGIWEHSLSTRPINEILRKISEKEKYLIENSIIPKVGVVGSGAAGVELAFAFKARWSRKFNTDVEVTIYASGDKILPTEGDHVR